MRCHFKRLANFVIFYYNGYVSILTLKVSDFLCFPEIYQTAIQLHLFTQQCALVNPGWQGISIRKYVLSSSVSIVALVEPLAFSSS